MSSPLYEWHEEAWRQVMAMRARMPHAILMFGSEGIGKATFAEHLAKSLLCESPNTDGHACGICSSCNWFDQYSHPDYRRVRPGLLDEEEAATDATESDIETEKKTAKSSKAPSKEIVIDQVRALGDFMNISTHRQGTRVVLMYPAEALNVPAANALLKSLEEPNPNTVFILVSHRLDRLLPTILSRCHKLALPMPSKEQASAWLSAQGVKDAEVWLAQQGGAPLLALEMAQSEDARELDDFLRALSQPDVDASLKLADKMQKLEMPRTVSWLQRWLYDVFSMKQAGRLRYYPKYKKEIELLASRTSNDKLMKLMKNVQDRQAIASHPLSAKLFLEDMLLEYSTAFR
ncbi:DNA polymerase III subunit delta' [Undibacterium cyanobacteriorum]|uniref:DNA polymerase III subunit delta' n=1 Tax=Undibacterium cyanobacteriorum TaxID=3073561 RepID=A0ABY9RCD5_9BURK|nr:DNA polymerase III subunit delta' [Undibacterium sp. 20NA77.5]WMW78903.1 DNA polymerase III subunit delta' [Undibacterium sp. 20NA77.5]